MKFAQQLPEYSAATMARRSVSRKFYRQEIAKSALIDTRVDEEARYYDNEFRKWHYKLAVIIVALVAGLFIFALNLPQLIDLIQF
jgi:hypothetical protein